MYAPELNVESRLVTLSACETAIGSLFDLANETTGMVEALFGVGASTLIASLWTVDDLSTFLIMDELYGISGVGDFHTPQGSDARADECPQVRSSTASQLSQLILRTSAGP